MIGAVIALTSAFCFALSDVFVRRGVTKAPVSYGAFVTVLLGVPLFAIGALLFGQLLRVGEISGEGYLYLIAAGIIHYVIGRYFNYAAINAMGATRAAPVQALGLPYSVLIAFLFLDEGVTLGMGAGIALIMVGPLLMVERRRQPSPVAAAVIEGADADTANAPILPEPVPGSVAQPFVLRQTEGYFFAVIAAISYGSSPVLIRAAIGGDPDVSILGGLVTYIAAAVVLLASLILPARRPLLKALNVPTFQIFFGAGFAVFLAQMFRFIALSEASVAVVATLLRFGSVFTLILSWYFNKHLENINWRVVAGVILSVAGAILIIGFQE
jgi:drug/metabolite transporter (DMT)-like permease